MLPGDQAEFRQRTRRWRPLIAAELETLRAAIRTARQGAATGA
jgi:hypothetical protein